jgi:hypothetical protein
VAGMIADLAEGHRARQENECHEGKREANQYS